MRFTTVFSASLIAPLVAAHGGIEGAPKIFGLPRELRASNPFAGHQARHVGRQFEARQGGNTEGRCGTQGGGASCAAGFCCSPEGYCGNTKDHCQAPDCQINYGPGCDANKTPAGTSTRDDARPQLGNIEYGGVGIRSCLKEGTVALTFDDGPYIYTEQVMAKFEARGGRATFFITGNNIGKGAIDENWRGVIQKMYDNGHQVASHTWSHQDLTAITQEQRYDQMIKNEMAIRNIIGKYPTYMRPPYSSCSGQCETDLKTLGYVVTSFDLDTDDYNQLTKEKIQTAKDNFKAGIDQSEHLSIAHDIHELTALNLTDYMLDYVYSNGLTAVTVGECMDDPKANWYRDSTPAPAPSPSSSAPIPTPTGPTSTDGQCGTTGKGQSCIGFIGNAGLSECCSTYGWCGNSADHCQTGCQLGFGKCGDQVVSSSASTSSQAASSSAPASSKAASSSIPAATSSVPIALSSALTSSKDASSSVHGASSSVKSSGSASYVSSSPSATPTTSSAVYPSSSAGRSSASTSKSDKYDLSSSIPVSKASSTRSSFSIECNNKPPDPT